MLLTETLNVMKTAASKLKSSSCETSDEVRSFGNFVVSKMNSYSEATRKSVEHAVFDILIKADRGYYENTFKRWAVPPTFTEHAIPLHSPTPILRQQQHTTSYPSLHHQTSSIQQQIAFPNTFTAPTSHSTHTLTDLLPLQQQHSATLTSQIHLQNSADNSPLSSPSYPQQYEVNMNQQTINSPSPNPSELSEDDDNFV